MKLKVKEQFTRIGALDLMANPSVVYKPSSFRYFPQLDSIRAIASIAVLLFHTNTVTVHMEQDNFSFFKGGFIGVDIFFVLSGYLITSILLKEYCASGTISFKHFYYKRLLRLYPPVLLAVFLFLVPFLFVDIREALSNMFFVLTYTSDVVPLFRNLIPALEYPLMFSHTWSLAVEEQFYIVYPLLFLVVMGFFKRRPRYNLISGFPWFSVIFIATVVISTILLGAWFYKFFFWRFFEIFFGAYIAIVFSPTFKAHFPDNSSSYRIRKFMKGFFLHPFTYYLSIFILLYLLNFYAPFSWYNLHYILITVVSTVIIVNLTEPRRQTHFITTFMMRPSLVYTGKISYGLYLYHAPLFHLQNLFWPGLKSDPWTALAFDIGTILLSFGISIASYEWMEKKVLAYKTRVSAG